MCGPERGLIDRIASHAHAAIPARPYGQLDATCRTMLVTDLGVATKSGHMRAIKEGRARWRKLQLRSAVRDNPAIAAEVLGDCGYDVTPLKPKAARPDKHTHY